MTTYAWTSPNSFTANTQNPSINNATVLASGLYAVVLTNSNNCSATGTVNVTINPTPIVNPIATPTAICMEIRLH
ncbi:MAG: hypothetical protein U5N85_00220 [Arcicella sp.]|nr:hypothetical protein [Arcicella sp.]